MSEGSEGFNNSDRTRPILLEHTPMSCIDCIDARMLVGKVVKIVESGKFELANGLEEFRDFMGQCTKGVTLEGKCGTLRKVCNHPELAQMPEKATNFFEN
jgi:hypothetical protein